MKTKMKLILSCIMMMIFIGGCAYKQNRIYGRWVNLIPDHFPAGVEIEILIKRNHAFKYWEDTDIESYYAKGKWKQREDGSYYFWTNNQNKCFDYKKIPKSKTDSVRLKIMFIDDGSPVFENDIYAGTEIGTKSIIGNSLGEYWFKIGETPDYINIFSFYFTRPTTLQIDSTDVDFYVNRECAYLSQPESIIMNFDVFMLGDSLIYKPLFFGGSYPLYFIRPDKYRPPLSTRRKW